MKKRFVPSSKKNFAQFSSAAKNYVNEIKKEGKNRFRFNYLHTKPYNDLPYNTEFYINMFDALSLLQTMKIRPKGKILHVGCGPGWMTEIMAALGYEIDVIEPCADFVTMTEKKVESFLKHLHIKKKPKVTIYQTTLEKSNLKKDYYDAVIFYAVFHHLIDENISVKKCLSSLIPGGVLGIHEGAWKPGLKEVEEKLEQEMKIYGTLESPLTTEYMDYLLKKHGFISITRYHQVNGLFPQDNGHKTVRQTARALAEDYNIITAVKPLSQNYINKLQNYYPQAQIDLISIKIDKKLRKIYIEAEVKNSGNLEWHSKEHLDEGFISFSLHQGRKGEDDFREAFPRNFLPNTLAGSQAAKINFEFILQENFEKKPWFLDIICEGLFWFSERGYRPKAITIL